MIYLICQDWLNTSNNHAGMKYLCLQLQKRYPESYKCLIIDDYYQGFPSNPVKRKIHSYVSMFKYNKRMRGVFKQLSALVQDGDKVILMEYMERLPPQLYLAKKLKQSFPKISLYGLVHLVPEKLESSFSKEEFTDWTSCVDKIMTLGSSLSSYFISKGIPEDNILTTFHYVDNEYYKRTKDVQTGDNIRVIAMGNQMRNVDLLKRIVRSLPSVYFTICQGVGNMEKDFEDCKNVELIPFVPEDELKAYMEQADISLNVMKDTIGSNVIVTSMAMGLAMICSDVGSIRDYCSEDNCIFCDNQAESFIKAISVLVNEVDTTHNMKLRSLAYADTLTIDSFACRFLEHY